MFIHSLANYLTVYRISAWLPSIISANLAREFSTSFAFSHPSHSPIHMYTRRDVPIALRAYSPKARIVRLCGSGHRRNDSESGRCTRWYCEYQQFDNAEGAIMTMPIIMHPHMVEICPPIVSDLGETCVTTLLRTIQRYSRRCWVDTPK